MIFSAILIALIACGYVQLLVVGVNRYQSMRWGIVALKRGQKILYPLMLLLPILVSVRLATVLPVGFPAEVSPFDWTLIAIGMCGVLYRLRATTHWWLYRRPQSVTDYQTTRHDPTAEEKRDATGAGPKLWQLTIPGNECFSWELTRITVELPAVPNSWNGLTILHLSDFHWRGEISRKWFEDIAMQCQQHKPDLVVFSGDLLDNMDCLDWCETTLGILTAPLGRYFILGNHDWHEEPEIIRRKLAQLGWIDISGSVVELEHQGELLQIAGDETPWIGPVPEWPSEKTGFRLFVSHTPDHLFRAEKQEVDLMLAGHTHGGQAVLPILGPIFSPSRFGTRYCGGQFAIGEMFLNVSRGLSGNDLYRARCLPEVNLIELRSPQRKRL